MMIYKPIMFALVVSLVLQGCSGDESLSLQREIEGYIFAVHVDESGLSRGECSDLMQKAFEVFKNHIEMITGEKSILEKLNLERRSVEVSPEFYRLVSDIESFHTATENLWDARIGGLRELWGIDSAAPLIPDSVDLTDALQTARQTEIELLDGNRISLKGDGLLYFGRVALGWAVDGATQVMVEGGVDAGSVEVDGIHRFWGKTRLQNNHLMTIKPLLNDSTAYRIAADPGGLCSIYLRDVEVEIDGEGLTGLINPLTGMPVPGYLNVTAWAPDATAACLYAEAMYVMKPGRLMRWAEMKDSVGVIVAKDGAVGMFAETDSRMDAWVTLNLP